MKKIKKESEHYSRRLYNPLYMHDLYCFDNVLILYCCSSLFIVFLLYFIKQLVANFSCSVAGLTHCFDSLHKTTPNT